MYKSHSLPHIQNELLSTCSHPTTWSSSCPHEAEVLRGGVWHLHVIVPSYTHFTCYVARPGLGVDLHPFSCSEYREMRAARSCSELVDPVCPQLLAICSVHSSVWRHVALSNLYTHVYVPTYYTWSAPCFTVPLGRVPHLL